MMTSLKRVRFLMNWGLILCIFSACSLPSKKPTDPLTASEQLLLSEAIRRGLKDLEVGLPRGTTITLDASGLRVDQSLHGDVIHRHMKNVVAGWLGRQGVIIRTEEKDATYRVHLLLESLGSTQRTQLFGMPSTRGGVLPIATPELALYKRIRRQGYVRFYFDIFEME
ncbi:MAG: hypothetical protein ABI618_10840, partial [Nitrospirota bacterium]